MFNQTDTELPGIAVIGSGYWGKNLVRNYHQIGALKLICDRNETIIESFRMDYPGVEVCYAYNDVLSRQNIKAIVIATPAETHYNLAREALLAGKHVYVEKPLVLRDEDAEALIVLAAEKKRILMVGHLLQYHPVFLHLKHLVQNGELGRINYIYSNRLNLGKIRREENILWSFAPHDISMILSLAGDEPESVLATGGNYLHQQIADVTTTHLEFTSGLKAHIFVSWLHPYKEQKLVIVGDRKMAVFNDTEKWSDKLLIYPHIINWRNNMPVPAKADAERFEIPEGEPLRKECEHFIDCIVNGKKPRTDGNEGRQVLKVLNAGQRSLNQNGCKISIRPTTETNSKNEVFIHETAIVDMDCDIGANTRIWHFSHILSKTKIGEQCNIGQNVVIGPEVIIGDKCKIQNNVSVFKGVSLEDGVFCGPSMVFTNVYNPRAEIAKMGQLRPTLVRKGATIGANATIICGVTIGRYAFIGAGAVVTRDIPDHGLAIGNPARVIGWMCRCGERLADDFTCSACSLHFENLRLEQDHCK